MVVSAGGAETGRERCLSLPEITADVRRPVTTEVEAFDPQGVPLRFTAEGVEARDRIAALGEHGVDDPQLVAAAWLHDVVKDPGGRRGDRPGARGADRGIVSALSVPGWSDQDAARRDCCTRIATTPPPWR